MPHPPLLRWRAHTPGHRAAEPRVSELQPAAAQRCLQPCPPSPSPRMAPHLDDIARVELGRHPDGLGPSRVLPGPSGAEKRTEFGRPLSFPTAPWVHGADHSFRLSSSWQFILLVFSCSASSATLRPKATCAARVRNQRRHRGRIPPPRRRQGCKSCVAGRAPSAPGPQRRAPAPQQGLWRPSRARLVRVAGGRHHHHHSSGTGRP